MRTILLMLMLLSTSAFGQAWQREATEAEAAWHKLQILATDDLESMRKHMAQHGVVFTDIAKVRAYAEQSQKEVGDAARASVRKVCSNRAALEQDQDLLIEAFKQVETDESAAAAKVIERMPEVLGEDDARAFLHFVAHGDTVTIGGMDPTQGVRSGDIKVDHLCRLGEAQ